MNNILQKHLNLLAYCSHYLCKLEVYKYVRCFVCFFFSLANFTKYMLCFFFFKPFFYQIENIQKYLLIIQNCMPNHSLPPRWDRKMKMIAREAKKKYWFAFCVLLENIRDFWITENIVGRPIHSKLFKKILLLNKYNGKATNQHRRL